MNFMTCLFKNPFFFFSVHLGCRGLLHEIEDEGYFLSTPLFGLGVFECSEFDTCLFIFILFFPLYWAFCGDHCLSSYCHCIQIAASPKTCPADLATECKDGDSDGWEGEFFPGIPKIKYEVRNSRPMDLDAPKRAFWTKSKSRQWRKLT